MRRSYLSLCLLVGLTCNLLAQSMPGQMDAGPGKASPNAPTNKLSPDAIDLIWQKSVSKYDELRAKQLHQVDNETGSFRPDWASLEKYQAPDWYRDAKFGIFVHWGIYSVPAFGDEWYPRRMYRPSDVVYKHHISTFGTPDVFGYKDLIPKFKAEHFDPDAWALLFKDSGAKYVVPVFEHHDGFAMYNSSLSDWTAVKMGPHRDLMGDLYKSLHAQHLYAGASFHRMEHDWFFDGGRYISSDVNDPKYASLYGPAHPRLNRPEDDHVLIEDWTYMSPAFLDDWLARVTEIVDKYHPDLVYLDWCVGKPEARSYLARLASYYYNESAKQGRLGAINYKYHAYRSGSAVLDIERGQLSDIKPYVWQTDTSVSNVSWGFIEGDTYKKPEVLVHQLVDIVSKNGNLLLNIGPRADGTISPDIQHVLLEIGSWLKVNGEAIYGTRPYKVFGEGPTKVAEGTFHDVDTQGYTDQDFRFTVKGNNLYAVQLAMPNGGEAVIQTLGTNKLGKDLKIKNVSMLGENGNLEFRQEADGLHLKVPASASGRFAAAYRIECAGSPNQSVLASVAASGSK